MLTEWFFFHVNFLDTLGRRIKKQLASHGIIRLTVVRWWFNVCNTYEVVLWSSRVRGSRRVQGWPRRIPVLLIP
jgi:hypothetical protein